MRENYLSPGKWRAPIAAIVAGIALSMLSGATFADYRSLGWGKAVKLERVDGEQVPGGCPIESPGGRFIYTARRPGGGDLDIAVNERASIDEPFEIGAVLPEQPNDPDGKDDFCPTPLPDNTLFFVSRRGTGCSGAPNDADMYVAVQNPATGWSEPVTLGCDPHGPNTPGTEFSPAVIKNVWGTFLFFSTDFYTGNQDIYVSRMQNGKFGPGVRLPYPINTEHDDRQPNVSQDGREIVFASDRDGGDFDIFYARRFWMYGRFRKATNLSETVPFPTADAGETRPSFSWDGERLVYGSGGVWISERNYRR